MRVLPGLLRRNQHRRPPDGATREENRAAVSLARGDEAAPCCVHEHEFPKGTTTVPLDGAARGCGRTRVLARGAMAAPSPSPSCARAVVVLSLPAAVYARRKEEKGT
jgi:hypothetical protein